MATFDPSIHPTHLRRRLDYEPDTGEFRWRRYGGACEEWNNVNETKRAEVLGEKGYLLIPINGKLIKAHRAAVAYMTGEWPAGVVDHKDRSTINNRWDNLRVATPQLNAANSKLRKDNTSGYKGVTKARGKWMAHITVDGRFKFLGYFANIEDAAKAHAEAAKRYFGDFATDGKSHHV